MDIQQRRNNLRVTSAGANFASPAERNKAIFVVRAAMKSFVSDDDTRRKILGFIFGTGEPLSTGKLSDGQILALKRWLKALPDLMDGAWTISGEASGELRQFAEYVNYGPIVQAAIDLGGEVESGNEERKAYYFQFEA